MLICGNTGHIIDATNTERASNLTLSQCVVELAVRLAEKESLTLFFSDGISPPSDGAKLIKIFEMDAPRMQFILQKHKIYNCVAPALIFCNVLGMRGFFANFAAQN